MSKHCLKCNCFMTDREYANHHESHDDQYKVELVENALRTEQDALAPNNDAAANAIETYLREAGNDSKLRFFNILAEG